uniref:Uncharacterized protein n=1 Tax=Ascaris lumbricoides TaxID=6252 RepID=A0A0M3HUZ8_ASCLU
MQVTGRQMVVDGVRGGVLLGAWRRRPSVQTKRGVDKVSLGEPGGSWSYNEGRTAQGREAAGKSPRIATVAG